MHLTPSKLQTMSAHGSGSTTVSVERRLLRRAALLIAALPVLLPTLDITPAAAQDVPPDKGGMVYSLGMPPVWKGDAGATIGPYDPGQNGRLNTLVSMGLRRNLGSPVVGLAALGVEGYAGMRGEQVDGGGRALFMVPALHFTIGADFNVRDEAFDLLLRLELPIRRGGILGRGTQLRIDYVPTRGNTLGVGVGVPLWGRNIGATRPKRNTVKLEQPPAERIALEQPSPGLDESLSELHEGARWITLLAMPLTDHGGADPQEAFGRSVAQLEAHIGAGRSLNEEIRLYHAELDRAFSIAAAGRSLPRGESTAQGRAASAAARRILLDDVVLPYNRLLGQRKSNDALDQFAAVGHAEYARWVLTESGLPEDRFREVFFVFQTLVDIAEEVRVLQRERWKDSRFVWVPLQLGLRPDEHDTQAEIDAILERAVGEQFTRGNHVWYVRNEDFQLQMARSVLEAKEYHVLWIHDFRGKVGGRPDEIAGAQTLIYLNALTRRVREYDETGVLPSYFIFIDQHYFELNDSRYFFRVLHDPLDHELRMPEGYEEWERRLAAAQDSLRQAVDESVLLRVRRRQYGENWLKNRIKVHINVTNPSDFSFNSFHMAGIIPLPDNIMRDHRKIAFYDVTEDDPYRGLAMYTGMGISDHYAGAGWEDRAIMVQGPSALSVKDAARHLLRAQGLTEAEMPLSLRAKPKPADYDARVEAERQAIESEWLVDPGSVLELHNETGFQAKQIDVAKAVIYSLMPSGSVLKIPDSLWQSYVYASLLVGSALRGCKVLIFAPALASAPSSAAPTMARAHGLFSALVYWRNELADEFLAEGGLLKIGLYAPRSGVGDLRGRIIQARETRVAALADLYPGNPVVQAVLDSMEYILDEVGYETEYLIAADTTERPKLHLKANFVISGEAWDALYDRPEWGPVVREYLKYVARETGRVESRVDAREAPQALQEAFAEMIRGMLDDHPAARQEQWLAYLTVGSVNMDYRSMVMDGEVMITVSGWGAAVGLMDFMLLVGLCEWIEDQAGLDALLPPPSGATRRMANLMKLML